MREPLWQVRAMSVPKKVIVIGGLSSVALALRRQLPEATYVVRHSAQPGDLVIGQYRDLTEAHLRGFDALINCAGATSGSLTELESANVELPAILARSARSAGVGKLVQVSSFAVYGDAERIDKATPARPASGYGRSKLAGDRAILEMADEGFHPVVVRLPAIVDWRRGKGKVAQLLKTWLRVRFIPAPMGDVRRSMISSTLAARVLAQVACASSPSVLLAADEQPFAYRPLADTLTADLGKKFGVVMLPRAVLAPLRVVASGAYQSLFASSIVDEASNFARDLPSDLYPTITKLAKVVSGR